jgi:hypothetical protein
MLYIPNPPTLSVLRLKDQPDGRQEERAKNKHMVNRLRAGHR